MVQKIVICGAGFLGSHIAKALSHARPNSTLTRRVQISSRKPEKMHSDLQRVILDNILLPPVSIDITDPTTLIPAFVGANVVISLVGVMHGSVKDFEDIQWKGAENIAKAAKDVGAKLIHVSAIGADSESKIPYVRTKGLGEAAVLATCSDATVIRPSLVFGPEDDFFNRFSALSRYLPFMPVFGGGQSRFQPVYVGDIACLIEVICRDDPAVRALVSGKIIEAGGPDVLTYRQMMELVLKYNHRTRPIVSLPFAIGIVQGAILERLPLNLFTVTRAQVEQLKEDNIVNLRPSPSADYVSFQELLETHSGPLRSLDYILPTYIGQT